MNSCTPHVSCLYNVLSVPSRSFSRRSANNSSSFSNSVTTTPPRSSPSSVYDSFVMPPPFSFSPPSVLSSGTTSALTPPSPNLLHFSQYFLPSSVIFGQFSFELPRSIPLLPPLHSTRTSVLQFVLQLLRYGRMGCKFKVPFLHPIFQCVACYRQSFYRRDSSSWQRR